MFRFREFPFPVVMASVEDDRLREYARRHILRSPGQRAQSSAEGDIIKAFCRLLEALEHIQGLLSGTKQQQQAAIDHGAQGLFFL